MKKHAKNKENRGMKKNYQEFTLEILLVEDDVVRCSNTYGTGDDHEEDIFD